MFLCQRYAKLMVMKYIIFILFITICSNIFAQEESTWESTGVVRFEGRNFKDDDNNTTNDTNSAVYTKLSSETEKEHYRIKAGFFTRTDSVDSTRDMVAPYELYLGTNYSVFDFKVGYQIFNWSALEFFHPVDIINTRNLDSNPEEMEKYGEFAFNLALTFENSKLELLYMPLVTDPQLPSESNRIGNGLSLQNARYVDGHDELITNKMNLNQYGMHYVHYFESMDIDLHYLHMTDKSSPAFGVDDDNFPDEVDAFDADEIEPMIHPYYFMVDQIGVAFQIPVSSFMVKGESVSKSFSDDYYSTLTGAEVKDDPLRIEYEYEETSPMDHQQNAIGLEYNTSYSNNHEATYIIEYSKVTGVTNEEARAISIFQNDIGVAYRHNFNDFNGKEIILVGIYDLDFKNESIWSAAYSQRLSEKWKMSGGIRFVNAPNTEDTDEIIDIEKEDYTGLKKMNKSDNIFMNLSRYF